MEGEGEVGGTEDGEGKGDNIEEEVGKSNKIGERGGEKVGISEGKGKDDAIEEKGNEGGTEEEEGKAGVMVKEEGKEVEVEGGGKEFECMEIVEENHEVLRRQVMRRLGGKVERFLLGHGSRGDIEPILATIYDTHGHFRGNLGITTGRVYGRYYWLTRIQPSVLFPDESCCM